MGRRPMEIPDSRSRCRPGLPRSSMIRVSILLVRQRFGARGGRRGSIGEVRDVELAFVKDVEWEEVGDGAGEVRGRVMSRVEGG